MRRPARSWHPRRTADHLMAGIWVHGEIAGDGSLAKLSTEVATLARAIAAEARRGRGRRHRHRVRAVDRRDELARFVEGPDRHRADRGSRPVIVAQRLAALIEEHQPDVMTGAGGGSDLAGALSALTGWGVLANASGGRAARTARRDAFGVRRQAHHRERAVGRDGIVTVRPNSVTAEPADSAGTVEAAIGRRRASAQPVPVVERLPAESAPRRRRGSSSPVGRRGGPDGFGLIEELAAALGAVGATRAAVDSWLDLIASRSARPARSSSRSSIWRWASAAPSSTRSACRRSTIVAGRDPDAPIADFADMIVIGDLVEVGNAILAELRARKS